MPITATNSIESYGISEDRIVTYVVVRRAIDEDGSVIGERRRHETVLPGQDLTGLPAEVRRVCAAVHTQAAIDAWAAKQAATRPIV